MATAEEKAGSAAEAADIVASWATADSFSLKIRAHKKRQLSWVDGAALSESKRHLEALPANAVELVKMGKYREEFMEGAQVRRLGKWYGDAMAMMLEHARMEQRLIFL
ncbi:uncharacterized protein C2845_PM02G02660 [Panicum miliaceum]|uniref:Uncharacterized protein n=1 Tax=Panicum miliaceum TaxID=4540 RepID=A0A3L6S527_PANMI|nr:uncharacterized protein C2845_PM02G02660 [Panicum miliaceum]